MFVSVVFIVRPATVWYFKPGDVCVMPAPGGRLIVCISRSVKKRPELLDAPNRREIFVSDADPMGPLSCWCNILEACQNERWDWCCQLGREARKQKDGSTKLTAWLREAIGDRLRLAPFQRLSAYSLRIAGASAAAGAGYDTNWIRLWGLWKTPDQVFTYIRDDYGFSEYTSALFQFGRLSVHTERPAAPPQEAVGHRARDFRRSLLLRDRPSLHQRRR